MGELFTMGRGGKEDKQVRKILREERFCGRRLLSHLTSFPLILLFPPNPISTHTV